MLKSEKKTLKRDIVSASYVMQVTVKISNFEIQNVEARVS